MRRLLLPLLLLAAVPALAAEHGAPAGASPDAPKSGRPGTNVDLEFLMAPLTGANGKLIGYAYINPRLTVVSEGFVTPVREKAAFIQDAFIRDINARGVATADNPQKVDIAGVEARLLANVNKIMGPGKVKMITVCTVQIAELRPTQTPSPTPADALHDVDSHGNPLKSRCEAAKAG
ncbi:MAG TPA: hypothetical protein VJ798_04860 [Rhizomicrobium sp.]|nr:hypothetical protein [Rhizomicrobium sp.]